MDDIGLPPYESETIEVWIHRELKNRKEPDSIADQLLKKWEKGLFNLSAKKSTGLFCFQNGFFSSLLRVLRADILSDAAVPWDLVYKVLFQFENPLSPEILDAFVAGATKDKQLHQLAVEAISKNDLDARWKTILEAEIKERGREANENRKKIIEDLKILRHEGMDTEVRQGVGRLLALFPDDKDGQTFAKHADQKGVDKTLRRIRQAHGPSTPLFDPRKESIEWPELTGVLSQAAKDTDPESAYNLSIGLHEMGLDQQALEVLRWHKKDWTIREQIWELEILVALKLFAETLSSAQIILQKHAEVEVVRAALYYSAHAYFGLNDPEQAMGILKGLLEHDPLYRDASILLSEWGQYRS